MTACTCTVCGVKRPRAHADSEPRWVDYRDVVDYVRGMSLPRASFACFLISALAFAAGCSKPTYPKCDKDDHCAEKNEVCVAGTCQQCRTESDCGDGQTCNAGRCEQKAECSTDDGCPGNQVCRSGRCKTECTGTSDCGTGQKCMDNRCVDQSACRSDTDCGTGQGCQGGLCVVNVSRSLSACGYPTVQFEFNRATLSSSARNGLEEVAECISTGGGTLRIEGHCDERGTEEYNLALGDRRARAVMEYLSRLGVPKGKMRVVSMGEAAPVSNGSNENAWAQNRRAEFEAE